MTSLKNAKGMEKSDPKKLKMTTKRPYVTKDAKIMRMTVSKMFKLFSMVDPETKESRAARPNPEYLTMFQGFLSNLQEEKFRFDIDIPIDFLEAYIIIMGLVMDQRLYTDFIILHRMKPSTVYNIWEQMGDFLYDRGYPIEAFIMYTAVGIMRMETRPMDEENLLSLEKAMKLSVVINSNTRQQTAVNGFKGILKNWISHKNTKLSLFLEALLTKALSTFFSCNAINFHDAIDFEIKFLSKMFEMGYFLENIEWLICSILNVALSAMDSTLLAYRFKQTKHLIHVAKILMSCCKHDDPSYQILYETYQLSKCVYWCMKINVNQSDISTRFQYFDLKSIGINLFNASEVTVSEIKSKEDILETFNKIKNLDEILTNSENKDITNIYADILRTCYDKYEFLLP